MEAGWGVKQILPLAAVRNMASVLGRDERRLIVKQIEICLRDFYVHLPLKISSLAIDPVRECVNLGDEMDFISEDAEFFRRLLLIQNRLRDRHLTFVMPYPWSAMAAFLPFAVESCWENGFRKLILTKYTGTSPNERLIPGVEITHWNAVPIRLYVESFAEQNQGSNPYARVAMSLRTLTARSLAYFNPPAEDWVSLTFLGAKGVETAVIPWLVSMRDENTSSGRGSVSSIASASPMQLFDGIDKNLAVVNEVWASVYSKGAVVSGRPLDSEFRVDRYLSFKTITLNGRAYGYLRIYSFDCDNVEGFLGGVKALLEKNLVDGLIVDVRANPGGNVLCGEGLLQLLTRNKIEPQPVSFRATDSTRKICGAVDWFSAWYPSLELLYDTGEQFSQGFPLTEANILDSIIPAYNQPIVIICDGLSYSTTDFFTVGARDNGVAKIIGVDPMIGAGGANVWQHSILAEFCKLAGIRGVEPMPGNSSFNFAARRSTRVGASRGIPVEGLGIQPDYWYRMTRLDVLSQNEDLTRFAVSVLEKIG